MNWKAIIAFISGAAIGGGVAYILTKRFVESKCDSEIEELRAYYAERTAKKSEDIYEEVEKDDEESESKLEGTSTEDLRQMAAKVRATSHLDYARQYSPSSDDVVEDKEPEKKISVIDENQYVQSSFDKRSLTYYVKDAVLIDDETEEIIDDIQGTVTHDALNSFNADGMLYIHNDFTYTDYEVQEDPRSYAEVAQDNY